MQYPEGHFMGFKPSILLPATLTINHLHETIDGKHSRKFRVRLSTFFELCIVLCWAFWLRHTLHAYVCVCLCLSALQGNVQKCHPDPLSQWLHCLDEGSITAWPVICIQMITSRSDLWHCNDKCFSIACTRSPEYGSRDWIRQVFQQCQLNSVQQYPYSSESTAHPFKCDTWFLIQHCPNLTVFHNFPHTR